MKKQRSRAKESDPGDPPVLRHAKNIIHRSKSDGSVVIMQMNCFDHFISIDKIAAEIWTMIDGKSTASQIKERFLRRPGLPKERFARDFNRLIARLLALNLLEK